MTNNCLLLIVVKFESDMMLGKHEGLKLASKTYYKRSYNSKKIQEGFEMNIGWILFGSAPQTGRIDDGKKIYLWK